jgi:hypothetical protein
MIHGRHLLVISALVICSFFGSASSAQEAAGLVLRGDACIRAEGLGQLERVTLALWLQVHRLPGEFNAILHSDGWDRGDWHLLLRPNGQLQNSVNGNNPGDARLDVRMQPDERKWRHLAVVYDAPSKRCVVYMDGAEAARISYGTALPVNLDAFCIGAWNVSERAVPGAYRDICIYSETLSAVDVRLLHAGREPAARPLARWRGVREEQKLTDTSGRSHHAQLAKLKPSSVPPSRRGNVPSPPPDGPVYHRPLEPEFNAWTEKGIASKRTFGAYYTRKNVDEKWHRDSRTDEFADVSVRFDQRPGELVFWRGSSYLPYWTAGEKKVSLEEIIPRTGDGPAGRPDKVNRYSRVRIIESTPSRVVVHWRYMPNMPKNVGPDNLPDQTRMVDEYFVISPDRSVVRAVLAGQPRYEDWREAAPGRVFRYQLTDTGIEEHPKESEDTALMLDVMGFRHDETRTVVPASVATLPESLPKPAVIFSFDEGVGGETKEAVSGKMRPVEGHAAHWRSGVSGTALQFDGWTSQVQVDRDIENTGSITLDAWIAIAAYPWNTCPIVQQIDVTENTEGNGVLLGLEADGKPILCATLGTGKRFELKAEDALIPRFRWTRLTGVVERDGETSRVRLYVDGRKVAEAKSGPLTLADDAPVRIGQGVKRMPYLPVGRGQYPSQYSFDGLIDEVGIFTTALTDAQIEQSTAAYGMTEQRRTNPDMIRRVLPAGDKNWNDFGARYAHLPFHESWNKMFRVCGHPDIVVSFDKMPCRFVLWHGVGYIPMLVSENGRWYSNEFNENWWKGCCEPMSDKKMVFGRVHILEQSPARVVLKWRYPLSTVGYEISYEDAETGWGNWSTWYMTIYPDGSIVKRMRIYMAESRRHEWQESMAIMGPEQRPEAVIDTTPALTVATGDGTIRRYSWIGKPPERVDYTDTILHIVNMKARFDPYSIQRIRRGDIYKARGGTGYSAFPAWNHWPVAQLTSDGRHATFPDRTAHSSLTHIFWDDSTPFGEQGLFQEKLLLEGMSDQSAEELLPLAKSWLQPAVGESLADGLDVEYDPAQRAYVLTRAGGEVKHLKVKLAASPQSPVVNPAFVVANWGKNELASISIGGKPPGDTIDVRQGVVRRANGVNALVVWIETSTNRPLQVTIQ